MVEVGVTALPVDIAAVEVVAVNVADLRVEVEIAEEAEDCPLARFWLEFSTHVVFPEQVYPKGQHWLPHNGRVPVRSVVFKAFCGWAVAFCSCISQLTVWI